MLTPLPFALHATTGCPSPAELALSLAGAFHDVDEARWLRWSRIDLALRAGELRLVLPFDENSAERAAARLEHVRAHFN